MKEITIAHISDAHFTTIPKNPFLFFGKRFLGVCNWLISRRHLINFDQLSSLSTLINQINPNFVFFSGDLTTTSLQSEFELAKNFISKFNSPKLIIPGNHDRYTKLSSWIHRFENFFGQCPSTVNLDMNWVVVTLDVAKSNISFSAAGNFSKKIEAKLLSTLKNIPEEKKIIILSHYPLTPTNKKRNRLIGLERLKSIITDDPRIKLFLHGHNHEERIEENCPISMDAGSCSYNNNGSFHLIRIQEDKIVVEIYTHQNGWKHTKTREILWNRGSIQA